MFSRSGYPLSVVERQPDVIARDLSDLVQMEWAHNTKKSSSLGTPGRRYCPEMPTYTGVGGTDSPDPGSDSPIGRAHYALVRLAVTTVGWDLSGRTLRHGVGAAT